MTYHLRGRSACTNNLLTPMERANEEVLGVLERQVLHPNCHKDGRSKGPGEIPGGRAGLEGAPADAAQADLSRRWRE